MSKKRLLFFLSLVLFFLFIFFSYLVAKERFSQIDFDMTVKFQDRIPRKWDYPFSILSVLGSAEITGIIWFVILVISLIKRYWFVCITLFLLPFALFIELYGKIFVHHPAPQFLFYRGVIDFNFPSHYVHTDYSYPSGHVTRTAFLICFLMVFIYLKFPLKYQLFIQAGLAVLLVAMCVSRIYLGEHWTTDVIGGLLLGASFGVFSALTVPTKKKTQIEMT